MISPPNVDFSVFALSLARGGDLMGAAAVAKSFGSSRVDTVLKAAVTAGSTTDPDFTALADYRAMATAFADNLRGLCVFDTLVAGGARVFPLDTNLTVISTASAGSVAEGAVKPVTSLVIGQGGLARRKVACTVVVSQELLLRSTAAATKLLSDELKAGVAAASDTPFLDALVADTELTVVSSGVTASDYRTDIVYALAQMTLTTGSRLYLIAHPSRVATLGCCYELLPDLQDGRGVLLGFTVLSSDSLAADTLLILDSSALVLGQEPVTLDRLEHGDVQLSDTPDAGAQAQVSLWQSNLVALRAERFIGWDLLRATGIATITGIGVEGEPE
jgi:hypothetical protein